MKSEEKKLYLGDIILAKDYVATGDFSLADQILTGVASRYSLNTQEQKDISSIQTIFDILSSYKVADLGQNEIDTLIAYSGKPGHSASMARSILTLRGHKFETQYVLPNFSVQNQIVMQGSSPQTFEEVTLYPNPSSNGILNIEIPNAGNYEKMRIDIWSLAGVKIVSNNLVGTHNSVRLSSDFKGGYVYRITADGITLKSGRILLIN